MATKVKYGKIVIVVLLTALIWIWADLAQDQEWPVPKLAIRIAKSADPALWASFKSADQLLVSSVSINNIRLKGPARKIADVEQMWNRGSLDLGVFLVPEQEEMTKPGDHALDVLTFLKRSEKMRRLGLTVESCEPKTVVVQTIKLVEQKVTVQCFDKSGVPQKAEVKPEALNSFVPPGRTLTAKVELTSSEIKQARSSTIRKTPYIEMPDGQKMDVSTEVDITMPPAEDVLSNYTVDSPRLVFAFSWTLQGIYKVQVTNENVLLRSFTIQATSRAGQAYKQQPFQMILCILDGDEKVEGELTRQVIYHLPQEFVRNDEIRVPPPPAEAKFKLIRLPTEPSEGE